MSAPLFNAQPHFCMENFNIQILRANAAFGKYRQMGTILTLFAFFFAGNLQAQGPCSGISFSFEHYEPCNFRARYSNTSECFIEIRYILESGSFSSWNVNTAAGFTVDVISASELWVHHDQGFVPLGDQVPLLFTLPYDLNTTMNIAYLDDCAMLGCDLFGGIPIESCPDPLNASIIGVKYRECNSLPYFNQPVLSDWTIQLLNADSNVIAEQVTDADGNYAFYDLPDGQYVVKELAQTGWTPKVPASGEYTVDLAASQQVVRNFGNCPSCSCDSIYVDVVQLESESDTATYFLSISNASPFCFSHLDIEVDSAQLINWQILLPNWEVEVLGPNHIRLMSSGPFLPGSGMIPLSLQLTGDGNQHIDVVTFANNGGSSQECRWPYVFPFPVVPIIRTCCPGGITGPEIANYPGFDAGTSSFVWSNAQYSAGVVNSPGYLNVVNGNTIASHNPYFSCVGKSGSPLDNFLLVDASTSLSAYVWEQQHTLTNNKLYNFCVFFNNVVRPNSNLSYPVVVLEILTASNTVVATSAPLTLVEGAGWTKLNLTYTPILTNTYKFRIRPVSTVHIGNDFAVDCASITECSYIPTLVCACPGGGPSLNNLIVNGDFTQGPTGFTTSLSGPTFCGQDHYNVLGTLEAFCPTIWPTVPPARSAPWMLCIDGRDNGAAPTMLWRSQISSLSTNSTYCFSFYWTPVFGPTTQNIPIDFQILDVFGVPVGTIPADNLSDVTGVWHPKVYPWSTGSIIGTGPWTIALRQTSGAAARDFGMDDICLIKVPPNPCTADISSPTVDNCGKFTFTGYANGGVPPYTYCWTLGGVAQPPQTGGNPNIYMYTFPTAGQQTVLLTIKDSQGCTAIYSTTVTAPQPITATISGNPGLSICPGQSTTLTAGGANWVSCQWSNSSGANSITVSAPGTYCVTCTDVNMCTASACATVIQRPSPSVSIQNPAELCVGGSGSFTATATPGSTLLWQSGATSTSIPINTGSAAVYSVLVTATLNGCTATAVGTVTVHPLPQANAGPDITVCQWQTPTLTASGGTSYQWSGNGSTANPFITPPMQVSGTYTVTVTDANGCKASDQVNITVIICDCEQNQIVQNGNFTLGTPCINTHEDINNATSWNGIWPDGQGLSVGDFYNTTTCTSTAAFGSLGTPAPAACGNFGAFWCNPHQTQVVWREGILNNLSVPIAPNSGNYMVSMKMACLVGVSGTPRMSVYGVRTGAASTVPGTNPLTATTPLNPGLFNPAAILLGKVYVSSTCNNNYMNVGFNFNANILPASINRIFLTRDDPTGTAPNISIGGSTFLAVDSFCVKPVFDSTLCDCGPLNFAYFWQQQTNWIQPINNSQPALAVPCPIQGANYVVFGEFHCAPDQCGNNTIDWKLDRPGNLPDLTGQSNNLAYPYFGQVINPADCSQSGNYQLTVTRHCGNKLCSKVFNFKLDACPCPCDSLKQDVGYGFSVSSALLPPDQCRKKLKPISLCVNDQVSWTISGISTTFTSTGNAPLYVNFPASGSYYICMLVQRTEPNGTICKWKFCRKVIVKCGLPPVEPATVFCPNPTVRNSGFTEGTTPGLLNQWGTLADWEWAPNLGDGLVFVEDSSGSFDEGHVVLRGRQGNFAGIMQEINLLPDNFTVIHFEANNYQGSDLPAGTRIEVRLQELPYLYPGLKKQVLLSQTVVDTSGWHSMGAAIDSTVDTSLHYLVICLQNDDPEHNSVVGIDNFEICSSPVSAIPVVLQSRVPLRIYPNPNAGTFTVDLPDAATADMTLRIIDLTGRLMQVQQATAGSRQQIMEASLLPAGLYFLQVVSEGKVLAVEKFVKQ